MANLLDAKQTGIQVLENDKLKMISQFQKEKLEFSSENSYCYETIISNQLYEVNDNEFYAGMPLRLSCGKKIGTIYLKDTKLRNLNNTQKTLLEGISECVSNLVDMKIKDQLYLEQLELATHIQKMSLSGGWKLNIKNNKFEITSGLLEIFQKMPDELDSIEKLFDIFRDDKSRLEYCIDKLVRDGEEFDIELNISLNSNETKCLKAMCKAIHSEDGGLNSIVGSFQDISMLKKADTVANEKSNFLDLAIQSANIGIWEWDMITNTFEINDRWATMLGLTLDDVDLNIKFWESLVHPDDIKNCWEVINNYIKGHTRKYENIFRMKHANGTWITVVDIGKFSEFDKQNNPTKFIGVHIDISNIKRSKEKLRLFFEQSTFGFAFYNFRGKIIEINKAFEKITGYCLSELKNINKLTLDADIDQTRIEFESLLKTGNLGPIEKKIITKNGNTSYVEFNSFVVKDYDGVEGIWTVLKDISEKKKLEEKLRHTHKLALIGELAAGVGHEINNPLTVINGYISTLTMKFIQNEPISRETLKLYLSKVTTATTRIGKIVLGLRTFSRSDEVDNEVFNIIESLIESIDIIEEIYKREKINIVFKNFTNLNHIATVGNRGRIQQVFMNILSNARDATQKSDNKLIEIICDYYDSNSLIFKFRDNGCGMTEEMKSKIFDPFVTTKGISQGTGIGMSIVYRILEEHGGQISIESTIGKGSTFTILLPIDSF